MFFLLQRYFPQVPAECIQVSQARPFPLHSTDRFQYRHVHVQQIDAAKRKGLAYETIGTFIIYELVENADSCMQNVGDHALPTVYS